MPAQEEMTEVNARLAEATPIEILQWGVERFFPRLTMATAFGPEGCILIHLLAEIEPRVRVFNLDTGYQFAETLALRDRIAERYGIEVEMIRPDTTVAQYEQAHGGPLYVSNSDQCCYDRKIVPLRRALVGYDSWITAIRADQSSHRAKAQGRGLGRQVRAGEDQPALELDQARRLGVYRGQSRALQSAARSRISVDRLLAVHAPVAAGEDERAGRWAGQAKTECGLHSLDSSQL